jgi:lipopolysaccharide/colanic/teichoic acid biosynthesis glycosyltransferase
VIYRQRRLGEGGRPFTIYKFRTMVADAEESGEAVWADAADPRVTRVGRVLRRTHLDELPQLFNVLRGDMALVGPRPVLPWEVELYQPHHRERFQVKPGITGLWQIRGRSRLSWLQALELDVEYARRRSMALDLWILVMTLPAVLRAGEAR